MTNKTVKAGLDAKALEVASKLDEHALVWAVAAYNSDVFSSDKDHTAHIVSSYLSALPHAGVSEETTPAAKWREEGKEDPHGKRYDCERAQLAMGDLTDDEMANAIFMADRSSLDLIAYQTAAKDRIRWLSRALEAALSSQHAEAAPVASALCSDCPPIGYLPDETRCTPCPRRSALVPTTSPAKGGAEGVFDCEDCIGMKDHGCYCQAMGASRPGGPASDELPAQVRLKLTDEDLDTINVYAWNEQTGRVTRYEIKELTRVYRSALRTSAPVDKQAAPSASDQLEA